MEWSWFISLIWVKPNTSSLILQYLSIPFLIFWSSLALRDIYLMFRAMDHSQDGYLNKEEFCRFFEYVNHTWTPLLTVPQKPWPIFKDFGLLVLKFLNSKYSGFLSSKKSANQTSLIRSVTWLIIWNRWACSAQYPVHVWKMDREYWGTIMGRLSLCFTLFNWNEPQIVDMG